MVSKGHFTRVDIAELKTLIYQKIGHKRSELYFNLLNCLFNSKISKNEFNKLCVRTVGREHLSLHNHLIRSLVKNASLAKIPPPKITKSNDPLKIPNGCLKKSRSVIIRGRKNRERPSPLGPLGKTTSPTIDQSPTDLNSRGSKPVEEGEEVEQIRIIKSPIIAPVGVSFNSSSSYCKKNIFKENGDKLCPVTCRSSGELPDTLSLRGMMEERLSSNGVGVSADCVKLLNNGLNVYLKRLIEPGMGLARSRKIPSFCMSMLDFRVSMESNPQILGENWPSQLEKVCSHADEE